MKTITILSAGRSQISPSPGAGGVAGAGTAVLVDGIGVDEGVDWGGSVVGRGVIVICVDDDEQPAVRRMAGKTTV